MTDVGLMREHNEDNFLVLPDHGVGVVADGMGGSCSGGEASRLVVTTFTNLFTNGVGRLDGWPFPPDPNLTEEENQLVLGVRLANRSIVEKADSDRRFTGHGSTIVAALFDERAERVAVAHVGDSCCYRLRGDEVTELTVVHSLVNDYASVLEELSPDQQPTPAQWAEIPRNVITRALGMREDVQVDVLSHATCAGDVYVLCSDGLSSFVTPDRIREMVNASSTLEAACAALIEEANSAGGDDNITVVLARVEDG
jgi:protein phosphatase